METHDRIRFPGDNPLTTRLCFNEHFMPLSSQLSPVYFIGAGPGAPDLITLRGQHLIARADCLLYADSLVRPEITQWAKPSATVVPTAALNLGQIVALMVEAVEQGQIVARIHSGDPALYGAIHEQMAALDACGIAYEIVPGVSSVFAAAAALGAELTAPEITQTLICARVSGRASSVPERESLRSLAAHGASLAIFLSITKARQVQNDLLTGYSPETPVAIVYRVTWPDQQIVRCRLAELAETVRAAGFTRHALIIVSPALAASHPSASKLYAPEFKHRFRTRASEVTRSGRTSVAGKENERPAIISITRGGTELARRLAGPLQAVAYLPLRFAQDGEAAYSDSVIEAARRAWTQHRALIFVAPVSICVRAIGPLAQDKHTDPAVVALDEAGKFAVSVLSGHHGGANDLARQIAALTGGQAVITTASDVREMAALDLLAEQAGWAPGSGSALASVSAAILNGDRVSVYVEPGCDDSPLRRAALPGLEWRERIEALNGQPAIVISDRSGLPIDLTRSAVFHPRSLAVGIGCRRGVASETIEAVVSRALQESGLSFASVACLATARPKAEEPGLLAFAEKFNLPLRIYEANEINELATRVSLSPSAAREKLGLPGVAEPCAMLAANTTTLLAAKRAQEGVTVAVARINNHQTLEARE